MPMTTVPDDDSVPVQWYRVFLLLNGKCVNDMPFESRFPPQRDLIIPVDGKEYILVKSINHTQVEDTRVDNWECKPWDNN